MEKYAVPSTLLPQSQKQHLRQQEKHRQDGEVDPETVAHKGDHHHRRYQQAKAGEQKGTSPFDQRQDPQRQRGGREQKPQNQLKKGDERILMQREIQGHKKRCLQNGKHKSHQRREGACYVSENKTERFHLKFLPMMASASSAVMKSHTRTPKDPSVLVLFLKFDIIKI